MRVRDTWLLEENYFDEPSDWAMSPDLKILAVEDREDDDRGFRSLREDPEARWHWEGSDR